MRKLSLFFLLLSLLFQSSLAGGKKEDSDSGEEESEPNSHILKNNDSPDGVPNLSGEGSDGIDVTLEGMDRNSDSEDKEVAEVKSTIATGLGREDKPEETNESTQESAEKKLEAAEILPGGTENVLETAKVSPEGQKTAEKSAEEGAIDPSDPRMQIRNHLFVHQPYLPAGWANTPFYSPMLMPVPPPLMQVNFKLPEPKKILQPSQVNMKSQVTVLNYPNHLPSPWNQYSVQHNYNPYGGQAFSMHHPDPFTPYSNIMQPYMSSMYRGMFDPLNMGIFPGSMPFSHMGLPSSFPNFSQGAGMGVGMNALNPRQFNMGVGMNALSPRQFGPGQSRSVSPNQGLASVDPIAAGVSGLIQQQNFAQFPPTLQTQPNKNSEMKEMIANTTAYDIFLNNKNSGPFGPFGDNSYSNTFSNANMMTAPAGPFGFNSPYAKYRNLKEGKSKKEITDSGLKENKDQPLITL